MRNAFAEEITSLAIEYPNLVLLSGDIGNRLFDDLKSLNRCQFLNCGVAEANMIGVAAGMALSGILPVAYTITPFITTRCFEQIRVDVCYHEAPVVIVGTGSGLSYSSLGPTHHSLEDLAIMRTLPGMQVLAPADAMELRALLREAINSGKPTYMRIGKKGEKISYPDIPSLTIGKANVVRGGKQICLISCGLMLPVALNVARELEMLGCSAEVVSLHTIKPLDEDYLLDAAARFDHIVTLEEHGLIGGMFSAVSELFAKKGIAVRLHPFGTGDSFLHLNGSKDYAYEYFKINPEHILQKLVRLLNEQ